MILNDGQTMLLKMIKEARAEEQAVIKAAEAEMKARLKALKEGEGYRKTHDLMRQAYAARVPKRQIGLAYGTKDANTINRILEGTIQEPYTGASPSSPQRMSVSHEVLHPSHPEYPENLIDLTNGAPLSKIWVDVPDGHPLSKIGGLSAVVDPAYKICYAAEPSPLTELIDGPRTAWPVELEAVLGPVLDNYNPTLTPTSEES